MNCQEVRDLAQYIFTRALDFVRNEPDLAAKVLEALASQPLIRVHLPNLQDAVAAEMPLWL